MKKIAFLLLIFAMLFSLSACTLFEDGYLYIGNGWQDTPTKALAIEEDDPFVGETLTVFTLLDTWYIDDMAFMLFVSEDDQLVEAQFVTNDEGQYHYHGYSCGSPDSFVLYEDGEHSLLDMCMQYGTVVYGYKYSTENITVNGTTPERKTYTFTCQGKEWSIDRWWVSDIADDAEVRIEYILE